MDQLILRTVLAAAVATLLTGCGGGSLPSATTVSSQARPAAVPSSPATPPAGRLLAVVEGRPGAGAAVHYLRVERADGTVIGEQSYRTVPSTWMLDLRPAGYRLISWHRDCSAACPGQGEAGLGDVQDVCGHAFEMPRTGSASPPVRLVAAPIPAGGCAITAAG